MAGTKVSSHVISDNIALGGSPTTTTQSASDNSTKLATTAYVTTAIANLADSAPSTLNTLNELAAALGDDANFSTTVTNSLAAKAPLASPTFTGTVNSGDITITDATPTLTFSDSDVNYEATVQGLSGSLVLKADANAEFGTESIQFHTGGSQRAQFDAAGNFGINTTGPTHQFHIKGPSSAYAAMRIESASTGHGAIINLGDGTDADYGQITQFATSAGEGGRMRFIAGGTETLNLRGGNVGIGTATPSTKLDVNGIASADNLALGGATVANSYLIEATAGSGNIIRSTRGTSVFAAYQSNNSTVYLGTTSNNEFRLIQNDGTALTIDTSKNVGINKTVLAHKFVVGLGEGDFVSAINTSNDVESANFWGYALHEGSTRIGEFTCVRDGTTNQLYIGGSSASQTLTFGVGAKDNALRLTSTGNLQFLLKGTNFESPGFTYHTNNYLYLRGGSSGLRLDDDSSINTIQIADGSNGYINFETGDGTTRARILHTGEVHITSAGHPINPTIKHGGATGDVSKLRLINRAGQAANKGGVVELGGVTDDGVSRSDVLGSVAGLKSNATSANREGYLQFSTSNGTALTERMRIESTGHVGIHRNNPSTSLELGGTTSTANGVGMLTLNPPNTSGDIDSTPTVIGFYHYYKTNPGYDYAHMKTNIPSSGDTGTFGMVAIEATGYRYSSAQTIKGMWGFHNWNGGIYQSTAENLISSGGHDFCHSAYVSSDNLIVLVAAAGGNGNQYVGARLDFIDIQADYARHIAAHWPPRVTAVSYSNNTTGVY